MCDERKCTAEASPIVAGIDQAGFRHHTSMLKYLRARKVFNHCSYSEEIYDKNNTFTMGAHSKLSRNEVQAFVSVTQAFPVTDQLLSGLQLSNRSPEQISDSMFGTSP
jgi:hypothetical protein